MKKLLLLTILLLPILVLAQPSIPGWTTIGTYGGHYYYFKSTPVSWTAAETECELNGGYLVCITSSDEESWLLANMVPGTYPWIGLSDAAVEGTFVWVTGEPYSYSNLFLESPNSVAMNYCQMWDWGPWPLEPNGNLGQIMMEIGGWTPLPVEMTSFTATGADNQVVLNWRTESETNNSHFNLYRSTTRDERGELISRVNGNGTTANANSYRYVDANVLNGTTYYYHISDVALDGAEHMNSFVVSATPALHATGEVPFKYSLVQNFPNPFNPSTTITYGIHKAGMVKLSVFNEMGREVATLVNGAQSPNTYKVEFNASNLPSGTYYYTLSTQGFTTSKKMVLTK